MPWVTMCTTPWVRLWLWRTYQSPLKLHCTSMLPVIWARVMRLSRMVMAVMGMDWAGVRQPENGYTKGGEQCAAGWAWLAACERVFRLPMR